MLQTPESTINAVVLLFGTPFPLNIPMLPSVPGKEPWIKQLHFARDVLDHENPVEWIVPRPDVCAISDEKRIHVLTQVTEICNLNRRAYWELAFLTAKTDQIQKLHASIDGHLESGASGICNKHFGNAIWDLHLALEKVLKIFLAQHGCSDFPHTLNNFKLIELSCKRGLTPLDGIRFDLMPSSEDAIKHRYGEIEAPSLTEIFEVYKVTLAAIGHVATELDHHEFGRRDHVYIRALPWAPIRKKHDLSLRIEG